MTTVRMTCCPNSGYLLTLDGDYGYYVQSDVPDSGCCRTERCSCGLDMCSVMVRAHPLSRVSLLLGVITFTCHDFAHHGSGNVFGYGDGTSTFTNLLTFRDIAKFVYCVTALTSLQRCPQTANPGQSASHYWFWGIPCDTVSSQDR